MRLDRLLRAIPEARVMTKDENRSPEIRHVVSDSRQARPGSLFVAIRGRHSDGHAFLKEAIERGAAAVVTESPAIPPALKGEVPVIQVRDARVALARLAEEFYGHPSSRLRVVGVTGTNGKTTVTYVIRSILQAAGYPVGLLGTVTYDLAGEVVASTHTTPESPVLQALLARLVEKGAGHVVMEVSSHALTLHRVDGCEFDVAVFTNLTQDHLDFHHTMEDYLESKRMLFISLAAPSRKTAPKRAVINEDDGWGRRLIESVSVPVWTYGLDRPADLTAKDLRSHLDGLAFTAVTPAGSFPVQSSLVGRYNVYNLLAAIGAALHLDIPLENIQRGIASLPGVPGRFERLDSGQGFKVIIDFAHTEDALDRLLRVLTELTPGRIITVFGCGGDRDRGKRAPMGRVAALYSDVVVITSDNPRGEDPAGIIKEVEVGAREGAARGKEPVQVMTIVDREEAIMRALGLARPGDAVVLAGKGHEEYQIIGDRMIPFNDRRLADDWIRNHRSGGGTRGS
ncbi:MAG TPA: UDP-N-acetylmuramoyl-L-alanyl-D-glutamate--2,6-diaminopimelate ligase [Nitrospiria bacterium]|nr:UDP-N-acetylmuramoyl-L-alanyl-D-glutamate--2,6-diaminopimelate ligase [Nitrospiria bacterium]